MRVVNASPLIHLARVSKNLNCPRTRVDVIKEQAR